jgi:hypothetical protein
MLTLKLGEGRRILGLHGRLRKASAKSKLRTAALSVCLGPEVPCFPGIITHAHPEPATKDITLSATKSIPFGLVPGRLASYTPC